MSGERGAQRVYAALSRHSPHPAEHDEAGGWHGGELGDSRADVVSREAEGTGHRPSVHPAPSQTVAVQLSLLRGKHLPGGPRDRCVGRLVRPSAQDAAEGGARAPVHASARHLVARVLRVRPARRHAVALSRGRGAHTRSGPPVVRGPSATSVQAQHANRSQTRRTHRCHVQPRGPASQADGATDGLRHHVVPGPPLRHGHHRKRPFFCHSRLHVLVLTRGSRARGVDESSRALLAATLRQRGRVEHVE